MTSGRGRKGRKNRAAALIFPPARHCGARQDGSGHTAMRCDGGLMRWRIKDLSGNNLFNLQQPLPDGGGSESVSERSAQLFRNES